MAGPVVGGSAGRRRLPLRHRPRPVIHPAHPRLAQLPGAAQVFDRRGGSAQAHPRVAGQLTHRRCVVIPGQRPGRSQQRGRHIAGWPHAAPPPSNDRSTLGMACFGSESASSGQIRCQSSGRKSILVTAPPVACSMAAQCSIGIAPRIFQLPIAAADTPSSFASVRRPPASRAAVSSRCSDRGSISVFISMTDFNTFSVFRSTPRDDNCLSPGTCSRSFHH